MSSTTREFHVEMSSFVFKRQNKRKEWQQRRTYSFILSPGARFYLGFSVLHSCTCGLNVVVQSGRSERCLSLRMIAAVCRFVWSTTATGLSRRHCGTPVWPSSASRLHRRRLALVIALTQLAACALMLQKEVTKPDCFCFCFWQLQTLNLFTLF